MGGGEEEVYISLYQIAKLQEILNTDPKVFIESYYRAYGNRPTRIEPLYCVANYFRRTGKYKLGYTILKQALNITKSDDVLCVEDWLYQFGILLEISICAFGMEKYEKCKDISEKLLKIQDLPNHFKDSMEYNLKCANLKIAQFETEKKETQ